MAYPLTPNLTVTLCDTIVVLQAAARCGELEGEVQQWVGRAQQHEQRARELDARAAEAEGAAARYQEAAQVCVS